MSKPQTVSRRALSYAKSQTPNDAYDEAKYFRGWAAGYRAAMKDVRKLIAETDPFLSYEAYFIRVQKFVNDTARLK